MIELPPPLWLPPRPAIIRPADRELLKLARRDAIKASRHEASFMPGMFPAGAVSSRPLPELSFVGLTHNDTQQTTYTFTGVNIGAADPTRRVIAVIQFGDTTGVKTLTASTMDGTNFLPQANVLNVQGGTTGGTCCILSRLKATGTTADFTFTLSAAAASMKMSLAIFRALNETSASPTATASDNTVSSLTLATTLNVLNKGWVLAAGCLFGSGAPTNYTWTGVTEVYEEKRGGAASTGLIRSGGGIASALAANAAYPVQFVADQGATGANGYLAAMSWG